MPPRKHPDTFYLHLLRELVAERGDVSAEEFAREVGVERSTITRRFGSWWELRDRAGLGPRTTRPRVRTIQPDEIRTALRNLVAEHGPDVTLQRFEQLAGVSAGTISKHFGTWTRLRALEGLPPNRTRREVLTPEVLAADLSRLRDKLGRIPTSTDIHRFGRYSLSTYYARIGNMRWIRFMLTPGKFGPFLEQEARKRIALREQGTPHRPSNPGRLGRRPPTETVPPL